MSCLLHGPGRTVSLPRQTATGGRAVKRGLMAAGLLSHLVVNLSKFPPVFSKRMKIFVPPKSTCARGCVRKERRRAAGRDQAAVQNPISRTVPLSSASVEASPRGTGRGWGGAVPTPRRLRTFGNSFTPMMRISISCVA